MQKGKQQSKAAVIQVSATGQEISDSTSDEQSKLPWENDHMVHLYA